MFGMLELILYHQVGKITNMNDVPEYLGYAYHICIFIVSILFLTVVGGMDAIPKMSYKWKVGVLGLVATMFSGRALDYQLIQQPEVSYLFIRCW